MAVPRIPLVIPAGASATARPSLYGHAPTIQQGARELDTGILTAGGIPQQLRRLMNTRVATIVGCPY